MSGASRKMKNPLLSAAGEGFPFDNYVENTFLVPVTPATPAVLRGDSDSALDNYVGQATVDTHNSTATTSTASATDVNSEFTPVPLHSDEIKSPANQPAKQGYLTSILSSLPNLSLSSITGDVPSPQGNQAFENAANVQDTNPFASPYHDRRDSLRDTSPPIVANFQDPRRSSFTASSEANSTSFDAPPQSTLPPTLPSTINGPVSYRLGNQRRLKYAPPPDLTSRTPKQYPVPGVQPLLTSQSTVTPTIFNPNEPVAPAASCQTLETSSIPTSSPLLQHSTPEYLSQASSLQDSYRSSPVAAVVPRSSAATSGSVTPQNQSSTIDRAPVTEKSSVGLTISRPIASQAVELTTPQNTPAYPSSFFAFDSSTTEQEFRRKSIDGQKESAESRSSIVRTDDPLEYSKDSSSAKANEDSQAFVTFAPVSAAQVSEKLEHLLAEQEQNPPVETSVKAEATNASVDRIERATQRVKFNDATERSYLSQTGVSLNVAAWKQEVPEVSQAAPVFQVLAEQEQVVVPQSHGVPANAQPAQQHRQPQPFASSADFFAEGPATSRSNLNYVPAPDSATVSDVFSISKDSGGQPTNSIFGASEESAFPSFQPKESNANPLAGPACSQSDFQQVPLSAGASVTGSTIPTYQPQWDGNPETFGTSVNATRGTVQSPPTHLFYDPAQFQSELPKHSAASHSYASSTVYPASIQARYFDGSSKPAHPQDITGSIAGGFLPVSSAMASVPEPTGSATLNPVQMSINTLPGRVATDSVPPSFQNLASSEKYTQQYRGVYHHWFYRKEVEHKVFWLPFSMQDSLRLEEVHNSTEITPETTVATDGGRYDVDILRRQRSPVYWSGASTEVRRCSWFFKGPTESRYVPYDESVAAKLEEEYKQACMINTWNRRIDLSNGEYVVFHSATVQVHYLSTASPELAASWGNSAGSEDSTYLQAAGSRPRVMKRGMDEFHIEDGEPEKVDHLLFLVHGIGSACDLKFRSVEEVVDEFRSISLQLVQSHYRTASEQRIVNRIEVLPVSWHTTLHSDETGIDKKLRAITLESIPKLRHFTNDTLLDILFYTSPVYCQTIMQTVGNEINRLYTLFKGRNPHFNGGIYLGGHSLGSLILFDLLCHQKPMANNSNEDDVETTTEEQNDNDIDPSRLQSDRILKRRHSKKISYVIGAAGTGQPYIHYPQLNFHPRAFFALGSPIGMFVTVRGIDMLGEDFVLPTCPAFFNIFHPFDPVAYRVEALINPKAPQYRPMLIPHHKGRKRMHLELKETMARVGADLKQKLLDSVKNTWNSVYQLALFHKPDNTTLEREIDKVVEEQLQHTPTVPDQQTNDDGGAEFKVGKLNGGRRIDYVLQEAPFEYINEYIFALTSHVCYWESEDTMLMILKEIYGSTGIQTDAQLPPQTMSIERVPPTLQFFPPSNKCDGLSLTLPVIGTDPTAPITENVVGPPPMSGFVRKS